LCSPFLEDPISHQQGASQVFSSSVTKGARLQALPCFRH
jgi:hypothetical protein